MIASGEERTGFGGKGACDLFLRETGLREKKPEIKNVLNPCETGV